MTKKSVVSKIDERLNANEELRAREAANREALVIDLLSNYDPLATNYHAQCYLKEKMSTESQADMRIVYALLLNILRR